MEYLWGSRFLAVVLLLGGGLGTLLSAVAVPVLATEDAAAAVQAGFIALLYVAACAVGVGLWRQRPYASRWATLIFALQVPVLSLPSFTYDWFTGAAVTYSAGAGTHSWATHFGAADHFTLASQAASSTIGVNIVALVAVSYLLLVRPNNSSKPTPLRGAA